jgi:tRNA pseudouridine38-40 synthase
VNRARRLALLVAYHGEAFYGFQRQPGFATVQNELEDAWAAVSAERLTVIGSGRTDSGVHAAGQVVHFDTWSRLPVRSVRNAMNAYLPEQIAVREVAEVPSNFHSNGSAIGKRYIYFLAVSETRPILSAGLVAWERRASLDLAAMQEAARYLIGKHDFGAFAAAGRSTATDVRTIQALHIRPTRLGLAFCFQGDGFLYKMVRNLVGTLVDVGRRRWSPEWVDVVLQSRDRGRAAATAAPQGLYLWRVLYPEAIFPGLSHPLSQNSPQEAPTKAVP